MEEKIIISGKDGNEYKNGRLLPQAEQYALCRCGRSKHKPFCDRQHYKIHFDGSETASREPFLNQAVTYAGPEIELKDVEELCAFSRFCHLKGSNVWKLTEGPDSMEDAIKAACDCPAGRLVVWDKKTGQSIEPAYQPSIVLLQDPSRNCSGPIWVNRSSRASVDCQLVPKKEIKIESR